MAETPIVKEIQMHASKLGARLFRNNVGKLKTEDGRWVIFGLCIGSSDLIGWVPTVITPEMVGNTVAVFAAVEVKHRKKTTKAQEVFIAVVRMAGGRAGVAHDNDEAGAILRGDK